MIGAPATWTAKGWLAAAASVVAAAVAIAVTLLRPSDEDRIRDALNRMCKAVAVKEDDNVLVRAGRVKSELPLLVTEDVRVDAADVGARVVGRRDLVDAAIKVGAVYGTARCEITAARIRLDPGSSTAKVDATALVTGTRGREQQTDRRDVHLLFRKDDGTWRATTIDVAAGRPE